MKDIKDWIALSGKLPSFPLGVKPELIHAMHSVWESSSGEGGKGGEEGTKQKRRLLKGSSYQRQWFLDNILFSGVLHYLCMQISL